MTLFSPTKAAQKYLVNNYASFQVYWCFYHLQLVMIQFHYQDCFCYWLSNAFLVSLKLQAIDVPCYVFALFIIFCKPLLLTVNFFIFPFITDVFNFPLSGYCLNNCCLPSFCIVRYSRNKNVLKPSPDPLDTFSRSWISSWFLYPCELSIRK